MINKKTVLILLVSFNLFAQKDKQINWYNSTKGLKTEKAYKFLKQKNKKGEEVIVAVIDSGIDIKHEDLQGKIWVNTKEIPDNKIDDDANGYIDDVNGWNFLGNYKGENQEYARYEKVRIYAELRDKYERFEKNQISENQEFNFYNQLKKEINSERSEYENYKSQTKQLLQAINFIPNYVSFKLNNANYTINDLNKYNSFNQLLMLSHLL